MDRRSWLWRRKSSEKSPGETESSGSASSHSERFFDDQELRSPNNNSPINTSPKHAESPEISPIICENEDHETVKILTEKLSATLLSINAKEDLVKQHSKVAEEAVSGWEKAKTEVAILKQQLEATTQKNSALEGRISHLDGALKECVRQLRQSRDEQEQKVHDVVNNKTQEWESNKSELENQLAELKRQLEASNAIEKENADLKAKLLLQSEELKLRTVETELSIQKAESASKQHLESIKKVAKLETECRKLWSIARKKSPTNAISSSACVESLTDSQSDNGDRLLGVDNEPSCSDSWASALIAELDQFMNEKSGSKLLATSVDIDLMDDFLEMERLAALDEADHGRELIRESSLKVEKIEAEKAKLEMALVDAQNHLEDSCSQLKIAEGKLVQLQKELDLAYESKQAAVVQVENVEAKRKALESQLESTLLEVGELQDKVASLEGKIVESGEIDAQLQLAHMEIEKLNKKVGLLEVRVEEERALTLEFAAKIETAEATRKAMESQLQEKVNLLEQRIEDERSLCREFAAKVEAMEIEREGLEYELDLARSEVQKLSDKVGLLEEKVEGERALNSQFAAKCQNLEDELSKKSREAGVRLVSISNGELTVKQEKELAVAAEKLAECQKTIASLGNQLKSLTTFDEFMIESEKLQLNGGSTTPPMLAGFGRLLSRTRSSRIENQ